MTDVEQILRVSAPMTHPTREVVAIVVCRGSRIGLFRRSGAVAHDCGLWHCVTGYLDPGTDPEEQALLELHEEAGLESNDLDLVERGPVLEIMDASGWLWRVHTFRVETRTAKLSLNWEHDAYRWVSRRLLPGFGQVGWLRDVIDAVNDARAA